MSRVFVGFGQVPYIGTPFKQRANFGPRTINVVPLHFDWISYGASSATPNINVLVNCAGSQNAPLLQTITSIYIDNTNSNNPIYVFFSDTNYTITAEPNSAGWYPALTSKMQFWVIGEGFVTGQIPQTNIIVTDAPIMPFVDPELASAVNLEKASPTITRGGTIYNTNFSAPALGDQFEQAVIGSGASTQTPIFGSPLASGFIYLTNIAISLLVIENPVAPFIINFQIKSTGAPGLYLQAEFYYPTANQLLLPGVILPPFQHQGKLDATQPWFFQADQNPNLWLANAYLAYTTNPQ